MKLTVLGCSGSMPGPGLAGLGLPGRGRRLPDRARSRQRRARARCSATSPLHEVDAIILSHLHADHCLDLTSYVVALRYGPDRGGPRIPVIGPAGTKDRIETAYDPMARKLNLQELFDFGAAAQRRTRPVRGVVRAGQPSGAGLRDPADRRRTDAGLFR